MQICPASEFFGGLEAVSERGFRLGFTLRLCGSVPVLQAAFPESLFLCLISHRQDLSISSVIDVGGRQVLQALVVAVVFVVLDEGFDLPFQIAGHVVVLQQDAVLHGLMPAFAISKGNMISKEIFKQRKDDIIGIWLYLNSGK